MENIPQGPTGSFGGPPQGAKKGLSKGCIIGLVVAGLAVVAGIIVVLAAAGGLYYFSKQAANMNAAGTNAPRSSPGATTGASEGGGADAPEPTAAQASAVAGGQSAVWEQQEISWTVPQRWAKHEAQTRKANGEVNEVRWLSLDGVRGVMFRESAPEDDDSPQRLQWMAYREYKGQTQLVNIILASRGKDFARHEDALYGILYSTKLAK
jgi:hypothetical protein